MLDPHKLAAAMLAKFRALRIMLGRGPRPCPACELARRLPEGWFADPRAAAEQLLTMHREFARRVEARSRGEGRGARGG